MTVQSDSIRIWMLWVDSDQQGEYAWLADAYCAAADEAHGGPPEAFRDHQAQWGSDARVIEATIPLAAILEAFRPIVNRAELSVQEPQR